VGADESLGSKKPHDVDASARTGTAYRSGFESGHWDSELLARSLGTNQAAQLHADERARERCRPLSPLCERRDHRGGSYLDGRASAPGSSSRSAAKSAPNAFESADSVHPHSGRPPPCVFISITCPMALLSRRPHGYRGDRTSSSARARSAASALSLPAHADLLDINNRAAT
jgi:hypothetical protein